MHSSRAACSAELRNACGALAGTLMVVPTFAERLVPRKVTSRALSDDECFLEVMTVRGRAAAGRNVHVNEGEAAAGVVPGQQDGVGVAHHG